MVSNASDDLPEPERPVNTTILLRGISTSTFLRLCVRAPRTIILSPFWSFLGVFGDISQQSAPRYIRGVNMDDSSTPAFGGHDELIEFKMVFLASILCDYFVITAFNDRRLSEMVVSLYFLKPVFGEFS